MPKSEIPSTAISITPEKVSVNKMATNLRTANPAMVGTVESGRLHLDLRTVFPHQDQAVISLLSEI